MQLKQNVPAVNVPTRSIQMDAGVVPLANWQMKEFVGQVITTKGGITAMNTLSLVRWAGG
jgi:hypothetical protein